MYRRSRTIVFVVIVCIGGSTLSGVASARNVPGSPRWCAHHPRSTRPGCRPTGTGPSDVTVTVSPDPVLETGASDVIAVLSVAVDPVYAEQPVVIESSLGDRCGGVTWISDLGTFSGSMATSLIDDDGNATFSVVGSSCAAGSVQVIADVEAGTDPTTTTTFTIDPPTPVL